MRLPHVLYLSKDTSRSSTYHHSKDWPNSSSRHILLGSHEVESGRDGNLDSTRVFHGIGLYAFGPTSRGGTGYWIIHHVYIIHIIIVWIMMMGNSSSAQGIGWQRSIRHGRRSRFEPVLGLCHDTCSCSRRRAAVITVT